MKKYLLTIIIFIIIISMVSLNADEKELKFPGKISLDFSSEINTDITESQPEVNYGYSDIYSINEIMFGIEFIPAGFYSIKPWLGDSLAFKIDYVEPDTFNLTPRNRFYAGLDNSFSIENVMDIGINFQMRLANEVSPSGTNDLEVMLAPNLSIGGEYDFGLTWGIATLFEFYLWSKEDQKCTYWKLEVDTINLAFEFLHFFAPEEISGSIVVDLYMLAKFYEPIYKIDNDKTDELTYWELYTGLDFDFFGLTPFIGFFGQIYAVEQETNSGSLYSSFKPGFKTGIGYAKDWFNIGIEYIGAIETYNSDPDIDVEINVENWQNHITAYVGFSL